MKTTLFIKLTACVLMFSHHATAIEPMDHYYADDISEAVDQAREQPHHYDYSNSYRYKRTTAQSIELNRMDLEELDDTRLGINTEQPDNKQVAFESGKQANKNRELNKSIGARLDNSAEMNVIAPVFVQGVQYTNSLGTTRATNIQSSGTIIASPKP